MNLKLKSKKLISIILSATLLLTHLPPVLADQQPLLVSVPTLFGELDKVTVTTPQQFIKALENGNTHIIVSGLITIGDKADATGRMLPVTIPAGTTIEGTIGSTLNCRCPIQLEGDDVTFKNIELIFESSDALGSIPHREIFLAGHSLTLNNVNTYLDGGDGSFGPLGGSEAELLPTVYAGGYPGTSVGSNANLTIINSNSKTMFQDIYMGHDEGIYQNVPYTGNATLTLDNPVTVRGHIYTDKNNLAEIDLYGNGNSLFNHAKATKFTGNTNTTLTLTECSVANAVINGVGTIQLHNNAHLTPRTNQFHNISLQENACLDLSEITDAIITGDFEGGNYNIANPSDTNTTGLLILDKEGSLTIEGSITGTTIFQTGNKNFPGSLVIGKDYIIADWDEITENFIIPQKYQDDGYKLQHSKQAWCIFKSYNDTTDAIPEIGSVEISYAPSAIDLAEIQGTPNESLFCQIIWLDTEDNIINSQDVIEKYSFDYENSLCVNTDYLNDPSYNEATDWGNISIELMSSEESPEYFYFIAHDGAKTGDYTFRFYSKNTESVWNSTIESIKQLDNFLLNEFSVYFYDSSNPDASSSAIYEQAEIQPIPEQTYTGKAICPEITVTHLSSGTPLTLNTDYRVSYEDNVNVGEATVKIIGIGNYSGEITAHFTIAKSESDVSVTATMGTGNQDTIQAVYGDNIRFVCQAVPAGAQLAKMALPNTVDFYCGQELLGTAPINSNGQAIFIYHTTEQKIPVGNSTVFADFGGTASLNPAQSSSSVSITLEKQTLAIDDIKSIALKDFSYDGTKKTTDIISLTTTQQTLFISGQAELASAQSGTYTEATVLSWSLNEKDSKWYQLPMGPKTILVDPAVTIIPAKAPEQVTISSTAKPGTTQNISILDAIPAELQNKVLNYELGKNQFDNTIISTPTISNGTLTYQAIQVGTETIPVLVTLENSQPMTLIITILVTDKETIQLNLTSPDRAYNGQPYREWNTSLESEIPVTITYYNLTEQQPLTDAPIDAGSYSITVHVESSTEIGEETSTFQILPKEVHICALDKTIQVGDAIPDISNPQLSIDYEFEANYEPIHGESLGTVKMLYQETPDNMKEGSYTIFIHLLEQNHKNYTITEKEGTLSIIASGEHIHNYTASITQKATCTENGIKTYTCPVCKDSYTEEIPATGHTPVIMPAIDSTCTETGKTEGAYCSVCNIVLTEQTTTPTKEHSYGLWVIDVSPTSTLEGKKHRTCSLCNMIETASIPKLESGDSDNDSDDNPSDNNDSENHFTEENSSTTLPEKPLSPTSTADSYDPIKGYISLAQGIITGHGNGYTKWKQTNGSWWLEYADGTWPHGQLTNDGQQIYQWEKINGAWYAFHSDGYAKHGWHMDSKYQGWFYIDINNGMKTGWQLIDGKWYYFNPISDGTQGRLFMNCYTPDGWYVDQNGAWDGKPQYKN